MKNWISKLARASLYAVRALGMLMFALYLLLLAHIPLFDYMVTPTWSVGVWLGLVAFTLMWGGVVIFAYSHRRLVVFMIAIVALHGAVGFNSSLIRAFDVDACQDSGGMWRDGVCEFERG